jgi:hypothetical protein
MVKKGVEQQQQQQQRIIETCNLVVEKLLSFK